MAVIFFVLLGILYNVLTALWIGNLSESKGHSFMKAFVVSLLLGPIIGLLFVVVNVLDSGCKYE
jgi:ABC-type Fe3+ transport system permease subunit